MQLRGASALIVDHVLWQPSFFLAMSELCVPCAQLSYLSSSLVWVHLKTFPIWDLEVFLQGLVQQNIQHPLPHTIGSKINQDTTSNLI